MLGILTMIRKKLFFEVTQAANPMTLKLSPTSFLQNASTANCSINISATGEWTIVGVRYIPEDWDKYPWCTIQTTSGISNGFIVVNIEENPTETKRGAIVTIHSGNVVLTDTIIQSAKTLTDEVGVEINGIIWSIRDAGAYGLFVPNMISNYGQYYQHNNANCFPNDHTSIGKTPYALFNLMDWQAVNDPSSEGWRIPARQELDALLALGYRWVAQEESYIGCAGAWIEPNAKKRDIRQFGRSYIFACIGYYE